MKLLYFGHMLLNTLENMFHIMVHFTVFISCLNSFINLLYMEVITKIVKLLELWIGVSPQIVQEFATFEFSLLDDIVWWDMLTVAIEIRKTELPYFHRIWIKNPSILEMIVCEYTLMDFDWINLTVCPSLDRNFPSKTHNFPIQYLSAYYRRTVTVYLNFVIRLERYS